MTMQKAARIVFATWLGLGGVASAQETNPPPAITFTNISQVRALSPIDIERSHRVELEGVVTLSIPARAYLWIDDGDSGIRLFVRNRNFEYKPGDRLAVTGRAAPGELGPMLAPTQIRILEQGTLPEPPVRTAKQLNAFEDLNRPVQATGKVREIVEKPSRWQVELESGTHRFRAELPKRTNDSVATWLNATLQLRGVCVRQVFDWGETVQPTLLVQSESDVEVLQPGEPSRTLDPEALPVTEISSLTREMILRKPGLVRIRGSMLDQRLGEYITVRDSSGTVRADSRVMTLVSAQELVEVWGMPAWEADGAVLVDATFRPVATNKAPVAAALKKPDTLPVLTNAANLLALTVEQAAWRYPVRLRGVVLIYYPERRQFFVQDGSAGFYVAGPWNRSDLKTGDLVEITGYSDPGGYAPMVIPRQVASIGTASLPEGRRATLFQMATGQHDSQWVEAYGVVRSYSHEQDLLRLKVTDADGTLLVYMPAENEPANLVDSVVRVRGVCTTHPNANRQISSLVVWSPSTDFLKIEQAGAENVALLEPQPISSLGQFRPNTSLQRRIRVDGVVTMRQGERTVFVQDAQAGVEVQTAGAHLSVKPGDRVRVTGYPSLGSYGVVLREAELEVLGPGELPKPRIVPSEQTLNPPLHNMLVEIDARLRYRTRINEREVLTFQVPGAIFEVDSVGRISELDALQIGSLLRVAGIYRVLVDETRSPAGFQMMVGAGPAIQVLEQPSWWGIQHTLALVCVLLGLVTAATFWVLLLRHKLRKQTASLQNSEMKFRSLVEQSLVGVYIIQDNRFAYVNPRLAEIFGLSPETMLQVQVDDVVHPDDRNLVREQVRRRVEGEVMSAHYSFRGVRPDGSLVHVEVLGSRTEFNQRPAVLGTALDISSRRTAEEELFSSQQMLRSVLDTIPQRVFWKDRNSVFLGCNKPFAQDRGCSDSSELIGKTDFDIHTPQAAAAAQAEDQEIMLTGVPKLGCELLHTSRDGRQSWMKMSKVPLFDQDGRVNGVLGTYEDITEHKQAEAALEEASILLETLLDNSPDYIYFKDRESRFVRTSKSLAGLFRLPGATELMGKSDFDFFKKEHAQQAFEDEQAIIRSGEPMIGKPEKETHPDGRITWALTTKLPWRDKHGNIIGTFGISKDVTAIKEAEAVLDYERELFRTLLDNFPDAIYFKDLQSRFVRFSRSKTENALEISRTKFQKEHPDAPLPEYLSSTEAFGKYLIGKSDFDTYAEDRARDAYEDEQRIIHTGEPLVGKVERNNRVDGRTTWCISTKMAWRNKDGQIIGTFGVSKDITALKEAEAKLETAHQRLLENSRLAGMAEVATDVLHNVGNVLNSVNISCSLTIDRIRSSKMGSLTKVSALIDEHRSSLGEFFKGDPRGQQIPDYLHALADHLQTDQVQLLKELEQLLKHIDHIKQIVAMQQSYAKVAGVKETVSASQLVEDALHINAAALVRHDVQVRREFQEAPDISTEKHKVLQILVNLIRNAKYAMDDAKRPDKLLIIRVGTEGNEAVKIQVIDNGVGIPAENLTRIFGHGFTTRRNGHGFGLHSSAIAVKELGGSLQAHSDGPGTGATFTLLLPCKPIQPTESERYETAAI